MFSFRERGADRPRGGGLQLTEYDLEELAAMDESSSDGEDMEADSGGEQKNKYAEVTEQFVFPVAIPPLEFNETIHCMRFTPTMIPPSTPAILPGVMKGLASNVALTTQQKRTVCGHKTLPMPVESSPIVSLFMTKVADGASMPWKPRYVSWMMSTFHVRELYTACINGLIEFHKDMTPDKIEAAHEDLKGQLVLLETKQDKHVEELLHLARADPLKNTAPCLAKFVDYLEEYAIYYLNLFERFLFVTLIELHALEQGDQGIRLEHVLTRRVPVTLEMCTDPVGVRQLVVDFFAIKVPAFHKRDAEIADYDYVPKQTINLQQLPHRIIVHPHTKQIKYNCPASSVYNGYIDILTIYEYFCFSDTENVLGNDFPWDPNSWNT